MAVTINEMQVEMQDTPAPANASPTESKPESRQICARHWRWSTNASSDCRRIEECQRHR